MGKGPYRGAIMPQINSGSIIRRALLGAPTRQHRCRYLTRPASANERLALNRAGAHTEETSIEMARRTW